MRPGQGVPRLLQAPAHRTATADTALPSSLRQTCWRLLSPSWELHTDALQQVLTDASAPRLVVGVLGRRATSTTTLARSLAGQLATPAGAPPPPPQARGEAAAATQATGGQPVGAAHHGGVSGVDVWVNPQSRALVLDAQPLPCMSTLLGLLRTSRPQLALGAAAAAALARVPRELAATHTPVEAALAATALQLALLLFTVCDVVVVLCDGDPLCDPELLELLEAVDLLAPSLGDAAGAATGVPAAPKASQAAQRRVADLVLVRATTGAQVVMPPCAAAAAPGARELSEYLAHTCWAGRGQLLGRGAATHVPGVCVTEVGGLGARREGDIDPVAWPPASLQRLVSALEAWPPLGARSEVEWLRWVERAWAEVQRSQEVGEFVSLQLRSRYAHGGGWRLQHA